MAQVERRRDVVLEVDARRRVSLGGLATHDRYLATLREDGTIVLTPAVVLPAADVDRFLTDPEATGVRRVRHAQRGGRS